MLRPGRHLYEGPLHSHTETSYAGTRAFMRHRAYMPATIVVARSLLSPMQWCGRCFSAAGQRVKEKYKNYELENSSNNFLKGYICTFVEI